jgi:hypothetical protein
MYTYTQYNNKHTFQKTKRNDLLNIYVEISLMIILIVCGNVPILQPAYSQENAASTTTDSGPSQQESNITIKIVVFLIFCYAVWIIYKRLKYRYGKYRRRQYFTAYIKEDTILKQYYKCAICKRNTGVWDYDHIDGNRSNNHSRNCQALCPNCHAKKTRGLLKQEKKSSSFL